MLSLVNVHAPQNLLSVEEFFTIFSWMNVRWRWHGGVTLFQEDCAWFNYTASSFSKPIVDFCRQELISIHFSAVTKFPDMIRDAEWNSLLLNSSFCVAAKPFRYGRFELRQSRKINLIFSLPSDNLKIKGPTGKLHMGIMSTNWLHCTARQILPCPPVMNWAQALLVSFPASSG